MKTVLAFLVCAIAMYSAAADNDKFWLGATKSTLKHQSLDVPRTIRQAMMLSCGGIDKYTRIIMVRGSRCFVVNGAKDLDVVRDFPILPSDRIQKYDENDLKEWNLPVMEGADAVAWLVESEKHRASVSKEELEEPQQTVESVKSSLAKVEPPIAPTVSAVPVHSAITSTAGGTSTSSIPWSIIVVLIVAGTGLLWLLLKRRTK